MRRLTHARTVGGYMDHLLKWARDVTDCNMNTRVQHVHLLGYVPQLQPGFFAISFSTGCSETDAVGARISSEVVQCLRCKGLYSDSITRNF